MALNAPATGYLNVLVGDPGTNNATPSSTLVATVPISSVLELQSTTRGFVPPRMTTAQRVAIVTPTDGMEVYDTTLGASFVRSGAAWAMAASSKGIQYATGNLTRAQLITMFSAPTVLLPAPGVGFLNVVNGFMINLVYGGAGAAFAGGGDVTLQYTAASNPGAGFDASEDIAVTNFTVAAINKSAFSNGHADAVLTANGSNAVVAITNAAADFTVGTDSSAVWHVWYSIVPVL
jgi:hypothetical protein